MVRVCSSLRCQPCRSSRCTCASGCKYAVDDCPDGNGPIMFCQPLERTLGYPTPGLRVWLARPGEQLGGQRTRSGVKGRWVMVSVVAGVAAGAGLFLIPGGRPGNVDTAVTTTSASVASTTVSVTTPATAMAPTTDVASSDGSSAEPVAAVTSTAPAAASTTHASAATTTAPPRGTLVIQGVGDVNFDPTYISAFAEVGYEAAFEGLEGIFEDDSITVINLECPPTDAGRQLDKQFSFQCDVAALPIAKANGVDVANLANNHSGDRGFEGLVDGRANVEGSGISPVGVGSNLDEAMKPALFDVEGWKVAVLGMGGVVPGDAWLATAESPGMASGDDVDQMVRAIELADEQADVVVVSIHWGRELVTEPDGDDRQRAAAMVTAGADVIFGHHPHRLGALEVVDGAPIFWTLGNFIWPRLSDAAATTAIGRVVIEPDGEVVACLVPAFIERSGRPVLRGEAPC